MSALNIPAASGGDARLRPLPWRRMVWVTWRQHRLALAGVVALFGAAAAYLLVTGLPMHDAYPAVAGCRPAGSDLCNKVVNDFLRTYAPGVGVTFGLLQAIPALIGAFAGAPLLANFFHPDRWLLWLGVFFVLSVYFFPLGIVGRLWRR